MKSLLCSLSLGPRAKPIPPESIAFKIIPEDSKVACGLAMPALQEDACLDLNSNSCTGVSGLLGPRRECMRPAKQPKHWKLPASSASLDLEIENLSGAI